MTNFVIWTLLYSSQLLTQVLAGCYFPLEFQGEFLSQSLSSSEIAYNSISILFDSIPGWGKCYRRIGNHVILSSEDKKCFKCLSVVPRSRNVLQIHSSESFICASTDNEALQRCPSENDIRSRKAPEIMLYKTRGFYGESAITRTYCPLNGNYKFTYSINDGTENDHECNEPLSFASDCPTGYKFDLHFKGCSFPDFDMSFQCLGSWPGENGETYISLLDTKLPQIGEEARPRYRCGIFKEDPYTGNTQLALSSDSTCTHHLYSSQDGYETLHLEKISKEETNVKIENKTCSFPLWLQGEWKDLSVEDSYFVYRDQENFVTYKGTCLESDNTSTFMVKITTECGRNSYTCVTFVQRDINVLEFQLGISSSDARTEFINLCDASNFPSQMRTMGRINPKNPSLCTLVGEYTGVIPDTEGLCTKSFADCTYPEIMYHTVFNCHNKSEIFEEREYHCFGQWEEDGLVYTYTERRDVPGTECFVGVSVDENRNVVTEAGTHCERGHQPLKYGMMLNRQKKCTSLPKVSSLPSISSERTFSPKLSISERMHNKEENKKTMNILGSESMEDEDIFTNEIPSSLSFGISLISSKFYLLFIMTNLLLFF